MTFVDTICAAVILVVFLTCFCQALLPARAAWRSAEAEHRTGQAIYFIAGSFRSECAKSDRSMERWKKTVAVTRELESCQLIEIKQGEALRAIKALCVISGEHIEIIGLCTP